MVERCRLCGTDVPFFLHRERICKACFPIFKKKRIRDDKIFLFIGVLSLVLFSCIYGYNISLLLVSLLFPLNLAFLVGSIMRGVDDLVRFTRQVDDFSRISMVKHRKYHLIMILINIFSGIVLGAVTLGMDDYIFESNPVMIYIFTIIGIGYMSTSVGLIQIWSYAPMDTMNEIGIKKELKLPMILILVGSVLVFTVIHLILIPHVPDSFILSFFYGFMDFFNYLLYGIAIALFLLGYGFLIKKLYKTESTATSSL